MKRFLITILLFLTYNSYSQVYQNTSNYGNRFKRTWADSVSFMPVFQTVPQLYNNFDRPGALAYVRSTKSFYQYDSAGVWKRLLNESDTSSVPTFQAVLNTGPNLTGSNTIGIGTDLRFAGPSLYFTVANSYWDGNIIVQEAPIRYLEDYAPFDSLEVPNMNAVKSYVSGSSFDTTITTTITQLTSSRFSNGVKFIVHPSGATYNSDWWDLVGNTLFFKYSLTLYNGQKIHIQL